MRVAAMMPGYMRATHRGLLGGLSYCQQPSSIRKGWGRTLQDLDLRRVGFASALQGPAVDKVQHHAVGELLSVLVGRIGGLEFTEMESLDSALLLIVSNNPD